VKLELIFMKTALILHGIGGSSKENWLPWLKKELDSRGWKVLSPDLPNTRHPDRKEWLETVKDLVGAVDFSELTIIGHSLGVPTALDLIETEEKKLKRLISVSGFYEDYGSELNSFFMVKRKVDMEKVNNLINEKIVIYGNDDPYVPQETLKNLADAFEVEPVIIKNGGHVNTASGYDELPLLFVYIK
jgi:predicted alpha/beta hydrolase family esterase